MSGYYPLAIVVAYIVGSFPTAYVLGRVLLGVDVRKRGDHNVGAANAFREIGALPGVAVLLTDVGKGILAVLLARLLTDQVVVIYLAGAVAVAGHNWSPFLGFHGGRGMATTMGVLFFLMPWVGLCTLGAVAIPFILTRNTKLAGTIMFIPMPLLALWFYGWDMAVYSLLLACLVGFTHLVTTKNLTPELKEQSIYMRRKP